MKKTAKRLLSTVLIMALMLSLAPSLTVSALLVERADLEVENLTGLLSNHTGSINERRTGADASGGAFWFFQPKVSKRWVQFDLPTLPAGTYAVYLQHKTANNRGIYDVSIGSQMVGTVDAYSLENIFVIDYIGEVTIEADQSYSIRFTNNGDNPAITDHSYGLAMDTLIFADPDDNTVIPIEEDSEIYDILHEGYAELEGAWANHTLVNYNASIPVRRGNNGATASWSFYPHNLSAGSANYTVYAWLPYMNTGGVSEAYYKVECTGGEYNTTVSQKAGEGNWFKLATINAEAVTVVKVTLASFQNGLAATAIKMVKTDEPADTPNPGEGPIDPSDDLAVLVNQSGYDAEGIKRATIPNAEDGLAFEVRKSSDDSVAFSGAVKGNVADFSGFVPAAKDTYYIQCGEVRSYDFVIANNWILSFSAALALEFMDQVRSDVWENGMASRSAAWRDGDCFSFELNSLVWQYLANPGLYENMPRDIYRLADTFLPSLRTQNEPDIVWLIKFGAERYYYHGATLGKHLSAQIKAQMAYFLYAYPYYAQYVSQEDYLRLRDWTISIWSDSQHTFMTDFKVSGIQHNLFETQTVTGNIKGQFPPASTVAPNLMMYEVLSRDGLEGADAYLDAALNNCQYVLEHYDLTSTEFTHGQRMSEHVTMENLTFLAETYPEYAPEGLQEVFEAWAEKAIARADNMWDYRKAADPAAGDDEDFWTGGAWAYHHGIWTSIMNEPGQIIGTQGISLAVARQLEDEDVAGRLREIAASAVDNMLGRNPQNRLFFYATSDIPGGDKGWWSKYAGGAGVLGNVPGRIDGAPKEDSYPYNPNGAEGYTEGWVAFNTAWNSSIAYQSADKIRIFADKAEVGVGEAFTITLKAPVNVDYDVAETVLIQVENKTTGGNFTLTLTENAADGTFFTGSYTADADAELEFSYGYSLFKNSANVSVTDTTGRPVISSVSVSTPTIVETLAAYLNIEVAGEHLEGRPVMAYLQVGDELLYETPVADGKGRMYIPNAPEEGTCRLVVKTLDETAAGFCPIEIVEYNLDIWSCNIYVLGDKLYAHFNTDMVLKTSTQCVNIGGKTYGAVVLEDKRTVEILGFDTSFLTGGEAIQIKGVKYPILFPSYSFTFTTTYQPS